MGYIDIAKDFWKTYLQEGSKVLGGSLEQERGKLGIHLMQQREY
jgi:hypothetical protein